MDTTQAKSVKHIPTYCYNCVSGPDFMTVKVVDGVATEVEPNFAAAGIHPAQGKVCVKAYGLVQKTYNPNRILSPMKRTNPRKGRDQDPGFVAISWDEALDTIADKLKATRAKGLIGESGVPRLAASFGHGGTPAMYMGTFPAFLAAWGGPIDFSFGSGQGVKCTHSEHLYGEFWHRGFTVAADTPSTRYVISLGANVESSGGPCAVIRHADARVRGYKRVQVEPHLSITGACSAEWVPIRPKTDPAFLFALMHVLLVEHRQDELDVPFLRDRTSSPYLVGPDGLYLRDAASRKPLVWDENRQQAMPFDSASVRPALAGRFPVTGAVSVDADDACSPMDGVEGVTAFSKLVEHIEKYSPEWAAAICDVPAETIRRIANEYLDSACIGETTVIDGVALPFRPVAVTLGKSVNNGWGAYECCWARTMLAVLVGALEVPGGTLGTTVRLNRPHDNRHESISAGDDGFMAHKLNPTDKANWVAKPTGRNMHRTLVPIVGNTAWSQSLGPTQLAWMFQREQPSADMPQPTLPDVWFIYRTNPAISFWDTPTLVRTIATFPFTVAFAYTLDETNYMADLLLPEATDLESVQMIRVGGTKFMEQFWDHKGVALRQPAVAAQGDTRDFSWISTELARRTGLLEPYNDAINRGAAGVAPLKGATYDFSLDPKVEHAPEAIWDAVCRAATTTLSEGKETHDLPWFKEHGFYTVPMSRLEWYLTPTMEKLGLRYELPYQERLLRIGRELGNRLHEHKMSWWDLQLSEYVALPEWFDVPGRWDAELVNAGAKVEDFPLWLLTSKTMQYHAGGNVDIELMREVSLNIRGHSGVIINAKTAAAYGIVEGDRVEIRSHIGSTFGAAVLAQGIRPDTLLILGQFDHWAQPFARNLDMPSLNTIAPMSLELTDATGSGADIVKVQLHRLAGVAA